MVEGKGGLAAEAGFEFQFVPQPDTRTKTEAGRVDMARRMGGLRAEVRDLAVLAVVVAGVGGWMMGAVWLFVGLMRWVRA